jgi:hypothetical protein
MNKNMRVKVGVLIFLLVICDILAHPLPDIPVRTNYENNQLSIQIEVDLRCLTDDPNGSPYILKSDLEKWSDAKKNETLAQVLSYAQQRIEFLLQPKGPQHQKWEARYLKLGGEALVENNDVVVVALEFQIAIKEPNLSYSVRSTRSNTLSVEVINMKNGKVIPRHVSLFPGEKSYDWALQYTVN